MGLQPLQVTHPWGYKLQVTNQHNTLFASDNTTQHNTSHVFVGDNTAHVFAGDNTAQNTVKCQFPFTKYCQIHCHGFHYNISDYISSNKPDTHTQIK